jgi:hypothetical protein
VEAVAERAPILRYTRHLMRRGLAILLSLLWSWMLIVPVFAPTTASNLPPCCRKNGKHHCAFEDSQSSQAAALSAVKVKCPCYPKVLSIGCQFQLGSPSTSAAVFAGIVQHPAFAAQADVAARVFFSRSNQKRGPPSFLLS